MNTARIRNPHALLRLVKHTTPTPRPLIWGPLSEPVDPLDTLARMRAQSILTPTPRGGICPPLTADQARDVLAWYRPAKP
jgi:hypothetical protein